MSSSFTPSIPFSGSVERLASVSASNDSFLEFEDFASDAFYRYDLYYCSVIPASDSENLNMQTSSDNGATYDSGASDYSMCGYYLDDSLTSLTGNASGAESAATLSGRLDVGNDTGESISGIVSIYRANDASVSTLMNIRCTYTGNSGDTYYHEYSQERTAAGIVNAFKVSFGSANILSGEFYLYGYK